MNRRCKKSRTPSLNARAVLASILSVAFLACAPDQAREAKSLTGPVAADSVTEGYALGFTYNDCVSPNITTDADFDGLDDTCEKNLATAFNPQLVLHSSDNTLREPAYAANRRGGIGSKVVGIMYMLSYWEDLGGFGGVKPVASAAHHGDSEFVDFNVEESGGIWRLNDAYLSAHRDEHIPGNVGFPRLDYSGVVNAGAMEYPGVYRGRPRIWVSVDKHANYASNYLCNHGNPWDSCASAAPAIFFDDALAWSDLQGRNVGSAASPMMDGVASQVPGSRPGTEYYWSHVKHFWGWNGSGTEDKSTPYWLILGAFGYNASWVPPGPLGVSIDGPVYVRAGNNCNWLASTTGGTGSLSYEWLRNDSIVSVAQNYAGNTGSSDFVLSLRVTDGTGVIEDVTMGVGINSGAAECTEEAP